jgi:hypothetical protein
VTKPSGWVGWVIFGSVLMITLGLFHIIGREMKAI